MIMCNGSFLEGGARIIMGCLFNIFSLQGGGNSKRDAYLKLGANSSIYAT